MSVGPGPSAVTCPVAALVAANPLVVAVRMKSPGEKLAGSVIAAVRLPLPELLEDAYTAGPATENSGCPRLPLRSNPDDCWVLTAAAIPAATAA